MKKLLSLFLATAIMMGFNISLAENNSSNIDKDGIWVKSTSGKIMHNEQAEIEEQIPLNINHLPAMLELYAEQDVWGKMIFKYGTDDQRSRFYDLMAKGFASPEDQEAFKALTNEVMEQIPHDQLYDVTEVGDACNEPFVINSLPFSETRSMADYHNYYFAPGNEVIYKLTVTETTRIKVSLCNTDDPNFDAFLVLVSLDNCDDFWLSGSRVPGHDDSRCGNQLPEIPYVELSAGDWAIIVDTWDPIFNSGEYTIDITIEDPIVLEPPAGAYMEQEACGDSTNNPEPIEQAEPINCGDIVCGSIWAVHFPDPYVYNWDVDAYSFTVDDTYDKWILSITGMAEFRFRIGVFLLDPSAPFPSFLYIDNVYPGEQLAYEVAVRPGNYLLMAYPTREAADFVCGENDLYYFQLDCGPIDPNSPENDWCEDVTPSLLQSGESLFFTGNTNNSTVDCINNGSIMDIDIIPSFFAAGEVWIAFNTTDTLDVSLGFCNSEANSIYNVRTMLYNDCPCGSRAVGADSYDYYTCPDGNVTLFFDALPPGTYYYEIDKDVRMPVVEGDYNITLRAAGCPQPQVNDNCQDAIPIYEDLYSEFNTTYANFDGPGYCLESKNVWYIYEPDETHAVSVSLEGSLFDTKMAVYEGLECPPSQESMIDCNNNYNMFSNHAYIEFLAVEGTQYLIEVGGTNINTRGAGFISISPVPTHDVRVDKINSPRPGAIFEPGGDYEIRATISNRGFVEETFDVIAVDNYGFELIEQNVTLAPGEQTILFTGNDYRIPSQYCENREFKVITLLAGDESTSNDTFTVLCDIPRVENIRHYSYYTDGEDAWVNGPIYASQVLASRFTAEARDQIVYLGAKIGDTSDWDETIDPVRLYLFLDMDGNGFPDNEPKFEAVVLPTRTEPDWVYAILPCDVTVDSGQVFWVGFGTLREGREGLEGIISDAEPDCDTSWHRVANGQWQKSREYNGDMLLGAWATPDTATGIDDQPSNLPSFYGLAQNYPNPFNARTTIRYNLAEPTVATVTVYDILGRQVETLVDEHQAAGLHQVTWNAWNVASGLYFYKIQAGDYSETKSMLLMK